MQLVARSGTAFSKPTALLGAPATGWNPVAITRVQGASRYDLAVALTRAAFPKGGIGPLLVVVGTNYPDALAAAPVSARLGGAVLLTAQHSVPAAVTAEGRRLAPSKIVVVGGPLAISAVAETQLRALRIPVTRIAGETRYDTAARLTALGFPEGADRAFVATGTIFPDGLAAGASGAALGYPVLLAPGSGSQLPPVTEAALDRLGATRAYALGEQPVMSSPVVSALSAVLPTERIGGATRYDTATLIVRLAHPAGGRVERIFLSTGTNFPDALAAGSIAGADGSALLLVQPQCVPVSVLAEMATRRPAEVVVLGGPLALGSGIDRLATCS